MKLLLKLAGWIDAINDRFGLLANWAVIISCFISCGNALVRFAISESNNGWLEIQWYLFGAAVMRQRLDRTHRQNRRKREAHVGGAQRFQY